MQHQNGGVAHTCIMMQQTNKQTTNKCKQNLSMKYETCVVSLQETATAAAAAAAVAAACAAAGFKQSIFSFHF